MFIPMCNSYQRLNNFIIKIEANIIRANWCMLFILLENNIKWEGFHGVDFLSFRAKGVGDIKFWWIFLIGNSGKIQNVNQNQISKRLVWLARWPKCYHVVKWFFLPKPGFWRFVWIFNGTNHLQINISHILNPKLTK
jgi:hypothetical protein